MSTVLPVPDEANGTGIVKNKQVDIVEEKDGSSTDSLEEPNNEMYHMNNNGNHTPDGSAMTNGTVGSSKNEIERLHQELAEKDRIIQSVQNENTTLRKMKQTIQTSFIEKKNEAEARLDDLERIREELNRTSQLHEESRKNLLSFEQHEITVENHLEMHRQVKDLKSRILELEEFDRAQMENDSKYFEHDYDNEKSNEKLLLNLQKSIAQKDFAIDRINTFKSNVIESLAELRQLQIQNQRENENQLKSGSENKEIISELQSNNAELRGKISQLEREKKSFATERRNLNGQISTLTRTINEKKKKVTKHDQELEKHKKNHSDEMERKNEEYQVLQNKCNALEEKLDTELKKIENERASRTNLKEQNARDLNKQKKEVSRQLDKEQEFRITLEHRLQEKDDTLKKKKITITKLNNEIKQLQLKLEIEEKKCTECQNETKTYKRRYDEAINNEKTATTKLNDFENEIIDLKNRLDNMTETNRTLNDAMRKKDTKLKQLQDKENEINKLQQDAANMERKAKQKLEKAKKIGDKLKQGGTKPSRQTINNNRNSFMKRNDPLYQYRNVLPFHWATLILLFVVFVMFCKANL